jgi:tight adherence protein C
MIAMAVLGAGLGGALVLALWSVVPQRTSIARQLARFDARTRAGQDREAGGLRALARSRARLQDTLSLSLARHGISYGGLHRDLALTGRTLEEVMAAKLLAFVAGVVLVAASTVIVQTSTDLSVPLLSPAVLALGVGAALFFVPDLTQHRLASARRREFRRALGAWLDLVALEMAGSAAPAEALPTAARVGTTWPMVVLGDTLYRATTAGQDHWEALTDLGHRIGIPELIDLATLARLVGRDGARVRDTLTARAASMRRALLADVESQAGRQDQSMLVAQILIGFGFVVFLMYPAIVNVMAI